MGAWEHGVGNKRNHSLVLVQAFSSPQAAADAVKSFLKAGFSAEEISVVFKPSMTGAEETPKGASMTRPGEQDRASVPDLLSGAWSAEIPGVGMVIGGPLILPASAPEGAGLARGLRELGIEATEASQYQKRLEAGETIIIAVIGIVEKQKADLRT